MERNAENHTVLMLLPLREELSPCSSYDHSFLLLQWHLTIMANAFMAHLKSSLCRLCLHVSLLLRGSSRHHTQYPNTYLPALYKHLLVGFCLCARGCWWRLFPLLKQQSPADELVVLIKPQTSFNPMSNSFKSF